MRKLFLTLLAVLVAAAFYTHGSLSEQRTDKPIISWNSDANPQRFEQMDLFRAWLVKNGHDDGRGGPAFEITHHSWSGQLQSTIIQAVSGVASDILDQAQVAQYAPMGILRPLDEFRTADSEWDYRRTYPAAAEILLHEGKQMGYACNAAVNALVFNAGELRRVGLDPDALPGEWTPDEFEAYALRYVELANRGLARREHFIGHTVDGAIGENFMNGMARSQGVDLYNETGTAAQCSDPRYVAALQRLHKWTFVDRIYPTASDVASMAGEGGFGGVEFSQFLNGKFASMLIGRWIVVRMRENPEPVHLRSTQLPMYGYKTLPMGMRVSTMYAGTRHPELAKLFFDFLADREYNEYIIRHGDGLPPNPKYAVDNPEFLTPPGFEHEGDLHANELRWARTIGMRPPFSPYFKGQGMSLMHNAISRLFNNLQTAEESMKEAEDRHNRNIRDTLEANPHLREAHARGVADQARIDDLKRRGEKIPASLVTNGYYLRYYRHTGQLLEDGDEAATPAAPAAAPASGDDE